MAASAFLVKLPETSGRTLKNGHNAMVVWAEDATTAEAICKAVYAGVSDVIWDDATTTPLVVPTELEGFRLQARIMDPDGASLDDYDAGAGDDGSWVEVVGANGSSIDDLGTAMATAINAAYSSVANAAYVGGSNTLTAATIADGVGDHTLEVRMFLPDDGTFEQPDVALTGFVGTITDEGIAGAALVVVLVTTFAALLFKVKA